MRVEVLHSVMKDKLRLVSSILKVETRLKAINFSNEHQARGIVARNQLLAQITFQHANVRIFQIQ
jgi:hypothetical protein